jgi:pyruvate dehydrogenase E1 component beta subunit
MTETHVELDYGSAIREGFRYLLSNHAEVFVIGQGLWSPWYVGNSMTALETEFGKERVIDTPVSEQACTGAALGASICGMRPIVVHPRIDFMMLATDQIATQAANWSSMFGARVRAPLVIRGIINRGGEQGAQHSQALHAWFAHVPGLRVAMPATVADARDLLVSAVLCDDPVLYIDDRWLYERKETVCVEPDTSAIYGEPTVLREGKDVTLVAAGYSVQLAQQATENIASDVDAEVIDLRTINPLRLDPVIESVRKTRRLVVVDGGWATCGLSAEIIASVVERIPPNTLASTPQRVTLPRAPAPTSGFLEAAYFPTVDQVIDAVGTTLR